MTTKYRLALAGAATMLFAATDLSAQDDRKVALTFGYPANIGIQWKWRDGLAVRTELGYSRFSTDQPADGWTGTTGVGLLWRVSAREGLTTYTGPRIGYSRSSGGNQTNTTYSVAALYGATQAIGKRFGVFGETGLMYSYSQQDMRVQDVSLPGINTRRYATLGGVGVLLWF